MSRPRYRTAPDISDSHNVDVERGIRPVFLQVGETYGAHPAVYPMLVKVRTFGNDCVTTS